MAGRHPLHVRAATVVAIAVVLLAVGATGVGAAEHGGQEAMSGVGSLAHRFAGTPQPVGDTARGGADHTFADPAGILIGRGRAQLYATGGSGDWGIATTTWQIGGDNIGRATDALSTAAPPRDALGRWTPCNDWAPTVAKLDGRYVMWFSAQIARGTGEDCDAHLRAPVHCLVYATSSSPKGGFRVAAKFCAGEFSTATKNHAPTSSQGLFDPTLFKDPVNRRTYLVWSQETFGRGTSTCAPRHTPAPSMLVGMAVSATGALPDGPRPLKDRIVLTSTAARAALVGAVGVSFGPRCEIENPQLVHDPADWASGAPGYLLVASLGTWNVAYAYHSIAVVCTSPLGGCVRAGSSPQLLDSLLDHSGSVRLENIGGLSVVSGSRTGSSYVLFAGARASYGPRSCYWESADFLPVRAVRPWPIGLHARR